MPWSSEIDICMLVVGLLEEIVAELCLPLTFQQQVGFFSLRPNITVVKVFGTPVGVVKVKKPGQGVMENERVLGELYDYMTQIVNFYGLKQVFGILTTYKEWRVCWLDNDESNKLAGKTPKEFLEPRTPVKEPDKEKKKSSPPGLTPSKKLEQSHTIEGLGDDQDSEVEEDKTGRKLIATRVWFVKENVFNLVGSALWKMNDAEFCADRIEAAQMVIQVTEDTLYWCRRPDAAKNENLQWTKVPNASRLLLVEDLGVGSSGRVWLVCSSSGLVGVLKFCILEFEQNSHLEKELERWRLLYPELGKLCSLRQIACHEALLMPHLCTPQRNQKSLDGIRQTLRSRFVEKGLKHGDVAWRNIGVYKDVGSGQDSYVVFDLEHVTESHDSEWLDDAMKKLEKKT